MERLGPIARKVLQDAKRAMEARKDGSERREGSEELKKPERSADDAQHPGSYRAGGMRGLETRGQEFDVCNNTAPVEGPVVTTTCPHTKRLVGGAVSGSCCLPALRIDLRAVPRRAWLGGGDPLPRPSSRLLVANNDNRAHASTTWSVP